MSNNNKVTVLTLVYNGMPYLKDAIESTLNQTYKNFDYLIIDDVSTDDSVACIKSYKDSRITFIQNEKNLNTSDSFNKALTLIKTEYIVRLDQDDISDVNRLQKQIDFLDANKDISIISSWEKIINSKGFLIMNWRGNIKNYGDFLAPILLGICPIWHPSIAFRTNDMIKIGGFDSKYARAEDFDVTSRFALNRFNASIIPEYLLSYRKHESSQSSLYDTKQSMVSNQIQFNALYYFLNMDDLDYLQNFLLLKNQHNQISLTKSNIIKIKSQLNDLFLAIHRKQNLTSDEFNTLKDTIFKRVGYGIKYINYFIFCNEKLFLFIFYCLSPQRTNLKKLLRNIFYKIKKIN
jgi:glycosyltransferase involved in cell wall biosynthesis